MTIYTLCPPGPAPRALSARSNKAKAPPQSLKRSAYVVTDRRGFSHTLGEISTCPQNEATVHDLAPRYEEWCARRRVWLAAPHTLVRKLEAMTPKKRDTWLRANAGMYRAAPPAELTCKSDDGEHYVVPAGYGRQRAEQILDKAVKGGFLSFGGRTLRIAGHASPAQGNNDGGTVVYALRGAHGVTKFTREALLTCIERGYL